jgi:hypothetical protein
MPNQARKRLTPAPMRAPAIGPAIKEPVMLEAMEATIAPNNNFPSTAMFKKPLRSATMPASAPIPTGIAKLSVLLKKTVRFAVVPSSSAAMDANRRSGDATPIATRHRKLAPRVYCKIAVAQSAIERSAQSATTGTENGT